MKLVLRQPSDIFLQFEHHALASSMKEERQNAYLQLIDRLLACESGEEIEILKARPDLLDDGLVQMMLQIAAELTAQGNLDTSNLLMNIAGQRLGVYDNTLIQAQLKVEADRILQQGSQQYRNNQFKAALQSWQQGLSIYRKIGDRAEEGRTLDDIGSAYYKLSRYSQALEFYQQALEIAQEIGDRVGESITLTNIGSVYKDLDHHSRALEMFEQALEIFQAIGDCNNEGITLDKIGSVYGDLGEHRKALEYLQHSLAIRREIGDRSGEGYTLNNIGVVYSHLGDYHQALECLQQSLTICRETDDPTGEAGRCTSIGQIYKCLGQYPQAIEFLQQGLRIFGEVDNRAGKGTTLNNIGGVYEEVGQYSQSLEFYQKALTIRREVGDREGEGDSLNNIGVVYDYLGQHFQALEFHKQALTLRTDIGDRRGQGTSLHNIGAFYKGLTEYSKALEFYEQALTLRRAVGDRDGEAGTLNDIGSLYLSLDQYLTALNFYQQALVIAREVGNQKEVGRVLGNMGFALLQSGDFPQAEKTLFDAIKALESLRTGLSDDDKVSIFEIFADAYRLLQQALIPQNKISEALEISERGRARAFVELLVKRLSLSSDEPLVISYPTLQQIRQTAQTQNSTLVEYSIINSKTLWIWVIKPSGEIVLSIVDLESRYQQKNTSLSDLVIQARESLGVEEKLRGDTPTASLEISLPIRHISQPLRQLHQYLIEPIASSSQLTPTPMLSSSRKEAYS
jgi:tetratricopeptide (TPR) repeat protein